MIKKVFTLLILLLLTLGFYGCVQNDVPVEKTKEELANEYVESGSYGKAIEIYQELNDTKKCKEIVSAYVETLLKTNLFNNAMKLKEKYQDYYDFDLVLLRWEKHLLEREIFNDEIKQYQFTDNAYVQIYFNNVLNYFNSHKELTDQQGKCMEKVIVAMLSCFKKIDLYNYFDEASNLLNNTNYYEQLYYDYLRYLLDNQIDDERFFSRPIVNMDEFYNIVLGHTNMTNGEGMFYTQSILISAKVDNQAPYFDVVTKFMTNKHNLDYHDFDELCYLFQVTNKDYLKSFFINQAINANNINLGEIDLYIESYLSYVGNDYQELLYYLAGRYFDINNEYTIEELKYIKEKVSSLVNYDAFVIEPFIKSVDLQDELGKVVINGIRDVRSEYQTNVDHFKGFVLLMMPNGFYGYDPSAGYIVCFYYDENANIERHIRLNATSNAIGFGIGNSAYVYDYDDFNIKKIVDLQGKVEEVKPLEGNNNVFAIKTADSKYYMFENELKEISSIEFLAWGK